MHLIDADYAQCRAFLAWRRGAHSWEGGRDDRGRAGMLKTIGLTRRRLSCQQHTLMQPSYGH